MINAAERILVKDGEVSALVITGTDKVESGFGNGDCLLLDFKHMVFALSDSAERYSRASRDILERFGARMEDGVPADRDRWLECVNGIYSAQAYQQRATFSCVSLCRGEDGRVSAFIIHGGDSMIFVVNRNSGDIEFQTTPDMNFAGRSRGISAVHRINLDHESRIVICSDGMCDIARMSGSDIREIVRSVMCGRPVSEIPALIHESILPSEECSLKVYDDIGLIVIDADNVCPEGGLRVLMGGTSPYEEDMYQKKVVPERLIYRWLGVEEMTLKKGLMDSCGIKIL